MTWAGVLVVSLFNLDLACAAASQALPVGLCKGTQGQMTVTGFPYLCYPHTFVFSYLEHLIFLVPVVQHKSWIRKGKFPLTCMPGLCCVVSIGFSFQGCLTKSRRDNSAEEGSSCQYFKRKNIWANMNTKDTKYQRFKALTELCTSRPMCTKQNSLQSLHLCSKPFMCLR